MPTSKDFQRVARIVKWDLDSDRMGFKTYPLERFITELNADSSIRVSENVWEELEIAFVRQGLFFFPSFNETRKEGSARVFRGGTTIARILSAIRSSNEGDDEEHLTSSARSLVR